MDYSIFYAVKVGNALDEITKHLAMNGYTYDTNCEDTIFIYVDELSYLLTILVDHEIDYEIM